MLHGTYIGPTEELKGETAIIQIREGYRPGICFAQFDNLEKFSRHEYDYALGWHIYNLTEFELDPKED